MDLENSSCGYHDDSKDVSECCGLQVEGWGGAGVVGAWPWLWRSVECQRTIPAATDTSSDSLGKLSGSNMWSTKAI